MANFQDRIRLVFDVDKSAGSASLKNFGNDFRSAEGFSNKFKVAAGGAMDYASQHAAQLAAVGGAALVAFGVKALGAFEDMARAAKTGADATGLSTEAMSRWNAVADDAGLTAEQITKSFEAIIKGFDGSAWKKYGIDVDDGTGHLKPANELMLEALDTLAKIPEGTERAAAGQALFKKSWEGLAPLVGKTRAEIEKELASVEKGQVITDKESASAERMRKAQDELHDALQEVTLAVGQMVAQGAPVLSFLAKATTAIVGLKDRVDELPGPLKFLFDGLEINTNPFAAVSDGFDKMASDGSKAFKDMSLDELNAAFKTLGMSAADQAKTLAYWHEKNDAALVDFAAGTDEAAAAMDAFNKKQEPLKAFPAEFGRIALAMSAGVTPAAVDLNTVSAGLGITFEQVLQIADAYRIKLLAQADAAAKSGDASAQAAVQQAHNTTAAKANADAADREAKAETDAAAAVDKLTDALKEQYSFQRGLVDAGYAYKTALQTTKEALEEYNKVQKDGKSADDARADSLNSTRDNVIATSEAFVKAKGVSLDSKEGIDLQVQALKGLINTLGPNDPLRTELANYVIALEAIPAKADTTVGVEGIPEATAALKDVLALIDKINKSGGLKLPTTSGGGLAGIPGNSRGGVQGFAGGDSATGSQGDAGDFIASRQAGVWVAAAETVTEAVQTSVEDQNRAEDEQMRRRKVRGDITEAEYLAYLERKDAAEEAAGRHNQDYEFELFTAIKEIKDAQATAEADAAKTAADAVAKAEEDKRKAIQETMDLEAARLKALDDSAQAQADLEVAAQKQLAAENRLKLLQIAAADPSKNGDAARGELAGAEADLAAATLAGAQARAKAMGLTPGSAAYNAQVQSDVAAYIAQHQSLGGGALGDLSELVKKIPSADDYAAALAKVMTTIVVPALAQAIRGVAVTVGPQGVAGITAEQLRQASGAR